MAQSIRTSIGHQLQRHRVLPLIALLAFATVQCPAQERHDAAKNQSRRARREAADSFRLGLRRAADDGHMLLWADSTLRSRHQDGSISGSRLARLRKRLSWHDRRLHRGDSLLASKYSKITYDTLYIHRPRGTRWTVKVRGNISGAKIETEGQRDGTPFHAKVKSDYRGTMSFAVTYRGVSLGFAINPAKIAGKSKDNELNLVSYGNKFGFDASYLSSKTYSGSVSSGGVEAGVSKGMVSQHALNFNAYYAFNGRRFSIPAAFTQSYIQRRSAGSVMVGVSFDGQATNIDKVETVGYGAVKLRILEVGIGAGYGYNLVAGKRWLFHLSALPTFDVFIKSHISEGGQRVSMDYKFPCAIITGRGAAVYSWANKFVGATMVYYNSSEGSRSRLHIVRDKWRLRVFYGFRF